MHPYLFLAQTGKVPEATVTMLWGLPVSTWLSLAGLVFAVGAAVVKIRRGNHDERHSILAKNFSTQVKLLRGGLPCEERLAGTIRLADELSSLRKVINLMSGSQAAYYDWLMGGGVPKLIERVAAVEGRLNQVVRLVDSYSKWHAVQGTFESLPKLLLVEDDLADVHIAQRAFDRAGVGENLQCVGTAEDALLIIGGPEPPDVVVLDYLLPGMNGEEMLEAMQSNDTLAGVRVVVASGIEVPARVHELADLVVGKPINVGEIMKSLRYQGLERYREERGEA